MEWNKTVLYHLEWKVWECYGNKELSRANNLQPRRCLTKVYSKDKLCHQIPKAGILCMANNSGWIQVNPLRDINDHFTRHSNVSDAKIRGVILKKKWGDTRHSYMLYMLCYMAICKAPLAESYSEALSARQAGENKSLQTWNVSKNCHIGSFHVK